MRKFSENILIIWRHQVLRKDNGHIINSVRINIPIYSSMGAIREPSKDGRRNTNYQVAAVFSPDGVLRQ